MNAIDESPPLRNWTQSAGEKWRMVSAMGSGSWARSSAPDSPSGSVHHGNILFSLGMIIFATTLSLVYSGIDPLSRLAPY
jgi:hypothetical protein